MTPEEKLAKFRAENPELYKEPVRCRRCNRVLTHPESIKEGIGPECKQKEGTSESFNNHGPECGCGECEDLIERSI